MNALTMSRCIAFANAVAPYDIFWLEEPLHWYLQPPDYQRLAASRSRWRTENGSGIAIRSGLSRFRIDPLRSVRFHPHAGFTNRYASRITPSRRCDYRTPFRRAFARPFGVRVRDAAFAAESHGDQRASAASRDFPRRRRAEDGCAFDRNAGLWPGSRLEGGGEVSRVSFDRAMPGVAGETTNRIADDRCPLLIATLHPAAHFTTLTSI